MRTFEGRRQRAIPYCQTGFSLVELMIVVAIMAILASVAIPAYSNYLNRARQTEAMTALMNAKMEQEMFWEQNNFVYAGTIMCLPSFVTSSDVACLTTCGGAGCLNTTVSGAYNIRVVTANSTYFSIQATRTIYGRPDTVRISATLSTPLVVNEDGIKLSILKMLFQ
jgi:type IV pilus assembly protein PilE